MQRKRTFCGDPLLLKTGQAGFSLAEALCAMAVTGLVLLSALRLLPFMYRQCHEGLQHMRLVRQIDHSLLLIEKDLRRAGLCTRACERPAVTLGERRGERRQSCLLVAYAFFPLSGNAAGATLINETFGYRLRRGRWRCSGAWRIATDRDG
ncbi:prepilin-type N-terminal cleavage/methylation domain-containing protein [Acerihabitans sp. KWT182]|uniref:Prepilin-type N-terminal cleavage/methylation domain-containing protein n=1 Tax=Acerihabitans sp. KWT182 TaxID=3157919 RepID=A0AAU7Q739_9GAMM